eukprot:SAG11_NODE_232_length_11930_cov_6.884794_6_plen_333_part_00
MLKNTLQHSCTQFLRLRAADSERATNHAVLSVRDQLDSSRRLRGTVEGSRDGSLRTGPWDRNPAPVADESPPPHPCVWARKEPDVRRLLDVQWFVYTFSSLCLALQLLCLTALPPCLTCCVWQWLDHGKHWLAAGGAEVDNNLTLPSEASVVELRGGNVLMNTRNSCHRLHAPNNCCWGPGCYDRAGVPHCHGPIACNHAHDHHHTRVLTVSTDAGASFSRPRWCDALPDPDCEGSMARDIQTGDLLFANNRDGTIGGRDNMTVYRARAGSGGACLAWHVLQQVDVGPAGYSCIASLPSRQLGVLYEHAWSAERAAHNDRDRTNLVFQLVAT